MTDKEWIYRRRVADLLQCAYAQVPAIAEANNIRRIVIPGQYTKYHRGDVLDLAASCTQGEGRVGIGAGGPQETGNDPRLIRQDTAGAVPATTHTKKAGCSLR